MLEKDPPSFWPEPEDGSFITFWEMALLSPLKNPPTLVGVWEEDSADELPSFSPTAADFSLSIDQFTTVRIGYPFTLAISSRAFANPFSISCLDAPDMAAKVSIPSCLASSGEIWSPSFRA